MTNALNALLASCGQPLLTEKNPDMNPTNLEGLKVSCIVGQYEGKAGMKNTITQFVPAASGKAAAAKVTVPVVDDQDIPF
jgi:hypothetical protein